jgi:putative lipoprotein
MNGAVHRILSRDRRLRRTAMSLLGVLAGTAIAGCLPRVGREQTVDITRVFTCAGDVRFSVREFGDVATVRYDMQTLALPRIRTASGSRYGRGDSDFRIRGETATLAVGATRHTNCAGQTVTTPWDEARLLGVDYRAVGRDPTWSLEIDDGRYIRFIVDGGSPVYLPAPQPSGDASRRVYHPISDDQDLEVVVEEAPCRDVRGAETLPHTVKVTFNGFPYPGCGRPVGPM